MLTGRQALEVRANIVADLQLPRQKAYVQNIAERIDGLRNRGRFFNHGDLNSWELHGWLLGATALADTMLVRAEMNDHVMLAAARLQDSMRLGPQILPSPIGMCVFEESVKWTDVRGKTITTKAIVWWETTEMGREGFRLAAFTSVLDKDDYYSSKKLVMTGTDRKTLMRDFGEHQLLNTYFMPFGASPGPLVVDQNMAEMALDGVLDGDEKPTATTNPVRLWTGLWMLMRQRFVTTEPERQSKSTMRRMQRSGVGSDVSVVGLGRPSGKKNPNPKKLDRDFHYPVDGYWRRRSVEDDPANPDNWFWVNPHLKGDVEGPLKVRDRVKTFGRKAK